jgi:hypothetical protein
MAKDDTHGVSKAGSARTPRLAEALRRNLARRKEAGHRVAPDPERTPGRDEVEGDGASEERTGE